MSSNNSDLASDASSHELDNIMPPTPPTPKPEEPNTATGYPKFVWLIRYFHKKDEYITEAYSSRKDALLKIECLRYEGIDEHLELVKIARFFSYPKYLPSSPTTKIT